MDSVWNLCVICGPLPVASASGFRQQAAGSAQCSWLHRAPITQHQHPAPTIIHHPIARQWRVAWAMRRGRVWPGGQRIQGNRGAGVWGCLGCWGPTLLGPRHRLALALESVDRLFHAVGLIRISGEAYDWLGERSSCLRIFVEFDNVNKVVLLTGIEPGSCDQGVK
jgi:hypothetical protein